MLTPTVSVLTDTTRLPSFPEEGDQRRSAVAEQLWRGDLLLPVELRQGHLRQGTCQVCSAIWRSLCHGNDHGKARRCRPQFFSCGRWQIAASAQRKGSHD